HCALLWDVHWGNDPLATDRKFCGGRLRRQRRYANNTDWLNFEAEVHKMGSSLEPASINEVEALAKRVQAVIARAVRVATPVYTRKRKRDGNAQWWSPELSRLRRDCSRKQAALRKARSQGRLNIEAIAEASRIARRRYTHAIKKAKGKSFRDWVSRLGDTRALKSLLEEAPVNVESVDAEEAASTFFGDTVSPRVYIPSTRASLEDMGGPVSREELE
ncbi:hypothetical protein FOZ62_016743, partial [Perkinsus olseni]